MNERIYNAFQSSQHTQIHHAHTNIMCTYIANLVSLEVSDIEDDRILDQQDTALTITGMWTPDTFGRNLYRRLGLARAVRLRPPAPHPITM